MYSPQLSVFEWSSISGYMKMSVSVQYKKKPANKSEFRENRPSDSHTSLSSVNK